MNKFLGTWKIEGRSMFNGIKIKIEKGKKEGSYIGRVVKINDNRWVKKFVQPGDIWIKRIKRNSNFEFQIVENKLAHQLFSLYGMDAVEKYRSQFIHKDTIGLGKKSTDLMETKNRYVRVADPNE